MVRTTTKPAWDVSVVISDSSHDMGVPRPPVISTNGYLFSVCPSHACANGAENRWLREKSGRNWKALIIHENYESTSSLRCSHIPWQVSEEFVFKSSAPSGSIQGATSECKIPWAVPAYRQANLKILYANFNLNCVLQNGHFFPRHFGLNIAPCMSFDVGVLVAMYSFLLPFRGHVGSYSFFSAYMNQRSFSSHRCSSSTLLRVVRVGCRVVC